MVFITIVTGAYKPTYILGASHCNYSTSLSWGVNVTMSCGNQGCDCGAVGAVGIALLLRTCWARPGLQHPNRLGGNFGQIKRHISPFNPTLWLSFTHKKAWSKPVSDRNQSFPEWKPWLKKKKQNLGLTSNESSASKPRCAVCTSSACERVERGGLRGGTGGACRASENGGFTSKNGSLSRNNKSFTREHHDFTSKNYLLRSDISAVRLRKP